MATTTSNQDLGITTTTSDHVVRTQGATDVNWNPPVKVPVPHGNQVPTTAATEHTTDRTQFGGGPVVRQGDAIGPSSGPPHPDNGAGGGVASATHLQEARITSGSPNVTTEGGPLGRTTDPTTQNHGNTVGQVGGANPNDTVPMSEEDKLLACSLDKTEVKCGHGRVPGREKLLEITSADTVELKATRKNAKTGGAPSCDKPPHTKWVIRHTKKGRKIKEETKTGDVITLDNSWFTWGDLDGGQAETSHSLTTERTNAELNQDGNFNRGGIAAAENTRLRQQANYAEVDAHTRAQGRTVPRGGDARYQSRQVSRGEMVDAHVARAESPVAQRRQQFAAAQAAYESGRAVYKATTSLVDLFKVWNAADEQNEVTVEAFACSGGDKYVLRSFPGKEIEFSLGTDLIDKIQTTVQAIQKVFRGVQKIATVAGLPAKADVEFFTDLTFKVACVWEEMKQDNAALRKYKHHCDRGWSFVVTANLAKVEFTLAMPVALFANLFVPGAGSALNSALNWIGFEATIGFDVMIKIGVGVWGERKPGASTPTSGGGFPIELEIYARVQITWRSALEVSGGIVVQGEPRLQLVVPTINLFDAYFKLLPGELKIGFRGVARVDLYFWKTGWQGEHFPESAKVSWSEMPMRVFSLLKQ